MSHLPFCTGQHSGGQCDCWLNVVIEPVRAEGPYNTLTIGWRAVRFGKTIASAPSKEQLLERLAAEQGKPR